VDGIASVRLEVLGYGGEQPSTPSTTAAKPPSTPNLTPPAGIFGVQVGAFRNLQNAERLKARIEERYNPVIIQSFDRGDGMFHRVRVGNERTEGAAEDLARRLKRTSLPQKLLCSA
jgi:rare lipoprotein A